MNIDEKLALLQGLFLQRAAIDDQIKALVKNGSESVSIESEEDDEPVAKKKTGKRRVSKYTRHHPMPEEVKEKIRAKLGAGMTGKQLAKEYGVSNSVIYKIGKSVSDSQTTKHNAVNSFVCVNGHEFNSKLAPGVAICPTCHTTDCDLGTLNGAVDEEEES